MPSPRGRGVSWLFFKARATSISKSIREERATRKNSQLAAAQRVAMKMGRRLSRGCGIGYVSLWICALLAPCRRRILIATKDMLISGTGHYLFIPAETPKTLELALMWIHPLFYLQPNSSSKHQIPH